MEYDLNDLDLLVRCLEKSKTYFPKWWLINIINGDLPWYEVKSHLKQNPR